MNEYYMNVNFAKGTIDTDLNKLVQNDYNSSKIKFTFDKEGTIQFKMLFPDLTTAYIDEIQNNEIILSEGLLSQSGIYKIEICISGTNDRLTDYATHEFIVRKELIDTDPIVEPDDRVPILDTLINDVNGAISTVENLEQQVTTSIDEVNNLDLDVSKEGKIATVTLTKKDATTKTVTLSDGTSLMFNWNGTSLGIKTDEDEDYTYVDLQGVQGETGPMGAPFTIKKTYPSVEAMNADFNNMNIGDYVMIASTVEVEDNAKLYTKGEEQWIFISDFSGAQGIKGETGATPNISIGTVTSGQAPSVTRTGTNENPVLNFVLEKGETGATGQTGPQGETGNGIASITKTGTSGLVDTYTITYTNGNTTTFQVTNGEDGEVTQEQLDETNQAIDYYKTALNALPKVSAEGTDLTLNDTAECPMPMSLGGNTEQYSTTGKNLLNNNNFVSATSSGTTITVIPTGVGIRNTTSSGYGAKIVIDNLLENTDYYIQYQWKNISNGENIVYVFAGTTQSTTLEHLSNGSGFVFNTSNNTTINIWFYAKRGGIAEVEYTNIMLAKSSTSSDYESFTGGIPAPNPEFPMDIHTISGDNEIKVENKNLFDKDTITLNKIVLKDDGTLTNANNSFVSDYIIVNELPNIILSGNTINYDNGYAFFDKNKTYISGGSALSILAGVSVPANAYYVRINGRSAEVNTTQLEKGSTATTYTPHQEQSLPLNLPVENLFDRTNVKIGYTWNNTQSAGRSVYFLDTQPNTTYTISSDNWNDLYYDIVFLSYIGATSVIYESGWINPATNPKTTFTTSNGTNILGIHFKYQSAGNIPMTQAMFDNADIMLEKGDKANSYTSYGTPALEYCKIGNYADEFYLATESDTSLVAGKWYLKKNIGKVVLDGTETWEGITTNTFRTPYTGYLKNAEIICISDHYIPMANGGYTNMADNSCRFSAGSNYLYIKDIAQSTASNLKAWLENNNTTIYYVLDIPTYILLNDTLQTQLDNIYNWAISYQEQTNISQVNNDLPFVIKVSAIRDMSNIFELIGGGE